MAPAPNNSSRAADPPLRKHPKVLFHCDPSDSDSALNTDFADYPDMGLNVVDYTATDVDEFPSGADRTRYMEIHEDNLNFVDVGDMPSMKEALLGLNGRSIYVSYVYPEPNGTGTMRMVTDILFGCYCVL